VSGAVTRVPPPITTLQGTAEATGELLRAPASGTPCVHWRLRIVEYLAPGLEFVHEVVSPEPLEIAARAESGRSAARVRVAPEDARLQAMPVLFREGTPGALAVAQQFGLRGMVRVEEVVIRHGDALEAEGVLSDPSAALSRGPFRTIDAPLELLSPTVRLETGLSLRPVILPWALGTAAALLTSTGVGAAIVHYVKGKALRAASLPFPAEIGTHRATRWHWP
jgi:hypothetical protein